MNKALRSSLLLLSLALVSGAAAQGTTLKIATMSPLSGPLSDLGEQIKLGAQLALNEEKAEFQKRGYNIVLTSYDDKANPDAGVAASKKLVADKSIVAVVGALNSGVTIPVSAALVKDKIAIVSPASTANQVTDRRLANTNRIVARDDAQGPAGGQYLVGTLKANSIYLVDDTTPYGAGLATEVEKFLKTRGVKVLGRSGLNAKGDFQALAAKIRDAKPAAVYFGGTHDVGGALLRELRGVGVNVPFMGGDALDTPDFADTAGDAVKGAFFTSTVALSRTSTKGAKFAADFKKTFGKDATGFAAFSYDAMKVVLAGVMNAVQGVGASGKMPTRASVQDAIRKVEVEGLLSGKLKFNRLGDRDQSVLYVYKMGDDKKPDLVDVVILSAFRVR